MASNLRIEEVDGVVLRGFCHYYGQLIYRRAGLSLCIHKQLGEITEGPDKNVIVIRHVKEIHERQ